MSNNCPLCDAGSPRHFFSDQKRDYRQCLRCELVFVPSRFYLSAADEKAEYDLHRNDSSDINYRAFLARLYEPLNQRLKAGSQGLDFGCGPGPTLSMMFEETGHRVALYDIFYEQDRSVLSDTYDFISASEVVEHLSAPGKVLNQLWSQIKPGGCLGIMTKLVAGQMEFSSWHYKNDVTHISFYSRLTFEWLGGQWGSAPIFVGSDVIIFNK